MGRLRWVFWGETEAAAAARRSIGKYELHLPLCMSTQTPLLSSRIKLLLCKECTAPWSLGAERLCFARPFWLWKELPCSGAACVVHYRSVHTSTVGHGGRKRIEFDLGAIDGAAVEILRGNRGKDKVTLLITLERTNAE
jgi:hypothetical protein